MNTYFQIRIRENCVVNTYGRATGPEEKNETDCRMGEYSSTVVSSTHRTCFLSLRRTHFPVMQLQSYAIFKKLKDRNNNILKWTLNFSWPEWKNSEIKFEKEYCWAITQMAGRSWCCSQSSSSVRESGFKLDSLGWNYAYWNPTCAKYDTRRTFRQVTNA
jgi:hypothetical protein